MFTWMTHWWDTVIPAQSWRVPPMTAAFLQKECAAKSQPLDWHQQGQQRAQIFKCCVFLSRKITSTERKVTFCKNTKSLLSFLAFLCEKSKHIFILLSFSDTIRKKESPSTSPAIKFTTTASDLHQVILQDNGRGCLNSPTDRINSGSLVNVT